MFDIGSALVAGFFAGLFTLVAALFLGWLAPRRVRLNFTRAFGTALSPGGGSRAVLIGTGAYLLASMVLAIIYAGILAGTGQAGSTGVGTLIGLVQWLITGLALGRYASRHPLVQAGGAEAPGYFVINHSRTGAVILLALHAFYGMLLSWLYGGFSGAFCPGCEFV